MFAGCSSRRLPLLTGAVPLLLFACWAAPSEAQDEQWMLNLETKSFAGASLDEVKAALESKEAGVRFSAVREIGRRGFAASAAVDRLLTMLGDDPEAGIRSAVAETVPQIGGDPQKVQAALIKALDDQGAMPNFSPVWLATAQSLGKYYAADSLDLMLKKLGEDDLMSIRAACVALAEMTPSQTAQATPRLLELIADDSDRIRLFAVAALGAATDSAAEAVPALAGLVNHQDFHTRYWACQALAKFGPAARSSVPVLVEALKEGPVSVRRHAALALGKIGSDGDEAVKALDAALTDRMQPVRRDALVGLADLGADARSSLPRIRKALETKTYNPRSYAALALFKITGKSEQTLQVLIEELQDSTATEAIEVFQLIGVEIKATPELRKLLTNANSEVRYFAMEALGTLGGEARDAVSDLRRIADNEQEEGELRQVAKETIDVIQAARK